MRALLVIGVALAAAVPAAHVLAAGDALPSVAHPNPAVFPARLDYANPLRGPGGVPATLAPLARAVIRQALADHDYLAYQRRDDLGGFEPAPIGSFAVSSGGHAVVGLRNGKAQIPHYAAAGGGRVNSFAFVPGSTPSGPPDNGTGSVPGQGTPPPNPPPGTTAPPPNQGFGGTTTTTPVPTTTSRGGGGGTTTRPKPPRPGTSTSTPTTTGATTTTPTATTTRTTTPATTTTAATVVTSTTVTTTRGGGTGGGGGGSTSTSCGTTGLSIESNLSSCRIDATNMAPGGSAFETLTIRNDSDGPFTLSVRATGTQNRLWDDLQMGIWEVGDAPPSPLPDLLSWTAADNDVVTNLAAGAEIKLKIELLLRPEAGNEDQDMTAKINLVWKARG